MLTVYLGKDCWNYCGRSVGHCPGYCGKDGYCCKLGSNGTPECKRAYSPCEGFHCCTGAIPETKLQNIGK